MSDERTDERAQPVVVRRMELEDVAAVAGLCGQLGYPSTPAQVEGRLPRLMRDADAALFVAESPDRRVLGWVHVCGTEHLVADAYAEVRGLVVDEEARGRGIGRALLSAAERWAAEHGYGAMRIRSNTVRAEARRFYEGAGYRVIKTQNNFHKLLSPEGTGE